MSDKKLKILVANSGGKDSQASLIWAVKESGYKIENIESVFCDVGWEDPKTYEHILKITSDLGVNHVRISSKKYDGFADMVLKKGRFPSTKARFCTEELKTKPFIDYILDQCQCHIIVVQGRRKDESHSRSLMDKQCTYFKYYFEPYGHDKNGKPKYHTYRKKEVFAYCEKYMADTIRPCFDWTAQETIEYSLKHGYSINPLYYEGDGRVGCKLCIMSRHGQLQRTSQRSPHIIDEIKELELEAKSTFFPPNYIPKRASHTTDPKSGKKIVTMEDAVNYVNSKNQQEKIFKEPFTGKGCMSFYGICE